MVANLPSMSEIWECYECKLSLFMKDVLIV